jgi:hypothetical protein
MAQDFSEYYIQISCIYIYIHILLLFSLYIKNIFYVVRELVKCERGVMADHSSMTKHENFLCQHLLPEIGTQVKLRSRPLCPLTCCDMDRHIYIDTYMDIWMLLLLWEM